MRCPKCYEDKSSVLASRSEEDYIKRRRECLDCSFRFTTFERVELILPSVIKKDGRREVFNLSKVKTGIIRACEKRPVSPETIDKTVEEIQRKVSEGYSKEITTQEIGYLIIESLKEVDQIAYVRFASVYREFSDLNQFVEILKMLEQNTRK
jgi:transcriptional repressor NrdR